MSADYDRPPEGTKTVCTNCGDPIVYDPINLWIHDGVSGDPVPCDGEVPVAEPLASWDWRDERWDEEDEPVCACGDDAADHVFTGGGFCNLCECQRYTAFGTRVTAPAGTDS